MRKRLYFAALALGGCLWMTSCDEALESGSFPTEYASVAYFTGTEDEPETQVTLLQTGEDVTYNLVVGKGGNSPEATGSAELKIMTAEELAAYNTERSTDYVLLPADFYTLSKTTLDFASGASRDTVLVTFKGEALDAISQGEYVLPFYLEGTNGTTVHDGLNQCVLVLSVDIPTITLDISDMQTVEMTTYDENRTATLPLVAYIDLSENKWAFEVAFETDDTALQQYVDDYKSQNAETDSYKLLPKEMYTLPSFSFVAGSVLVSETLSLDLSSVSEETHYLLPVVLKGCVGVPFKVEQTIRYVHVYVKDQLPEIELTEEMLAGSFPASVSEGRVIANLFDGNQETCWGTSWQIDNGNDYNSDGTPDPNDPKDSKFGVWLDIELDEPVSIFTFSYQTQNVFANVNPQDISIYVYNEDSELATAQPIKTATNLSSEPYKWISFENFRLDKEYSHIRISITKANNTSYIGNSANVTRGWAGIAELRLYGQ